MTRCKRYIDDKKLQVEKDIDSGLKKLILALKSKYEWLKSYKLEEASLAESIRLQTLKEEETAKQVHLDVLLAKRMEEEELTEQQKQEQLKFYLKAQQATTREDNPQGDSETDEEESVEDYGILLSLSSFGYKIQYCGKLEDISTRLVMQKYGTNRPKDVYDTVLWSDLRTMFNLPLNEDAIWSLPLQQKIISWRYYDMCDVHCLTLEACSIYMLADRKYPLSKDACQVMLKMKLLDGKMNEVCYKLLKMIEKQAGVRKC
ncbi:hypothetical protein Tco_1122128 [Tanacetum coccineum]|uniref:Uncharacterized protein n=1 Tax=Tanacetum coccineum TaxID=301880 RepID=A0ABQ5J2A5_9ASTR